MSRAAPAIPLFGDAYIADTRHLSLEEHGAYLQLMMIAWRTDDCSLPDDDVRVARMLGITAKKWAKLKPVIMEFWTLESGRWMQKRLTKERRFVAKKSEQNAEAANARWGAKSLENNNSVDANADVTQCERSAPPPLPPQEEESSIEDSPSDDGPALKPEHVFEFYRELAEQIGKPVPRDFTPERRAMTKARIAQYSLEDFQTIFAKCRDSPFLRGDKGRGPLTFDWLMKKGNFQKVLEGNYDG